MIRPWPAVLILSTSIALAGVPPTRAIEPPDDPPGIRASLTFRYQDDDGPGRLIVTDVPDAAEGEPVPIRVSLTQRGIRHDGSGVLIVLSRAAPRPRIYAFAIATPQASYFFQGRTTSGITVGGGGTYHPIGSPERPRRWSIVLGGG